MSEYIINYDEVVNSGHYIDSSYLTRHGFFNINFCDVVSRDGDLIICFDMPQLVNFSNFLKNYMSEDEVREIFFKNVKNRTHRVKIDFSIKNKIIEIYRNDEFKLLFKTGSIRIFNPKEFYIYFNPESEYHLCYIFIDGIWMIGLSVYKIPFY